MLTKLQWKGFPFFWPFFCLCPLYGQSSKFAVVPASGPNMADGKITLLTGQNQDLANLHWKGPKGFSATTPEIQHLYPGTYCLTAIDKQGQKKVACKYLNYQCPDPGFEMKIKQPVCGFNNGELSIKPAQESDEKFIYQWNTKDTSQNIFGLKAGYYHLTITHEKSGCLYFPGIQLFEREKKVENFIHTCSNPPTEIKEEVVLLEVGPAKIFGAVRKLAITALYPNPFQNKIFLEFNSFQDSWITIVLQDTYCRHVFKDIRFARLGANRFELNYPDQLPIGLYILAMSDPSGFTVYQKLLHTPQSTIP